jgi:hypothetical protein
MKNVITSLITLLLLANMMNKSFGQWIHTNGPYGGNIHFIAIDGDELFAGSFGTGVYLSTNNGENWTSRSNGLANLYINSLAINDSIIFAGTWEGVYLSTNKGNEWEPAGTVLDYIVSSVAISDSTIFAGTWFNGLYISSNCGKNWTKASNGMPDASIISSIVVIGNKIYVGLYEGIF